VQGPGSALQILSLVGDRCALESYTNLPHIFLDQLWGPSGTAVIYKSSLAGLVVKFSLTDRQERLRSERGLLAEKQVYEHLKDKGLIVYSAILWSLFMAWWYCTDYLR
jgi:hypothetical protein